MVKLVVWDFDEESTLETALNQANIEYQLSLDLGHYGMNAPYLVVDGVPLDKKRAMIWIKEHTNEC
jgi:hypothetical protein